MVQTSGSKRRLFTSGVLLLATALAATGCTRREDKAAPAAAVTEAVTFCQGGILAPLPLIARDEGMFAAEGVNVTLSVYGDGKLAMDALLSGACQFAIVGEPPLVKQSFERDDFVILATTLTSENATKVLARRDRGIASPPDLKGKTIGVRKGTISHHFLDILLKKYGIRQGDVTLRFMELKEMPAALTAGEIDAYSSSDIYYLQGLQLLGDRVVTLSEPGLCYNAASLVAKRDYVASHGETARKVVKALIAARTWTAAHPRETEQRVAAANRLSLADVATIMREQRHDVILEQPFILSLEDHARWLVGNGAVQSRAIPNYLHFVDPAPLAAVQPSAMTISR